MIKRLDECDVNECRALCDAYGLEYELTNNKNHLRKLLKESTSIDPEAVDVPEIAVAEKPAPVSKGEARVKVIFPKGEGADGTGKIKVTINGYRRTIPRDVPVELPESVLDFLDTCVIDELYRNEAGEYQTKPRHRFPYQMVR